VFSPDIARDGFDFECHFRRIREGALQKPNAAAFGFTGFTDGFALRIVSGSIVVDRAIGAHRNF